MKVVGLITEYNPFHNGHKYHIEEARRVTGADYCIAVMSGSFVQRGAPAIIDKYSRARMALLNGVDLVLELPVCFSTASAEYFAHGAVSLLDKLGVVDFICFGSECGNINILNKAAELLLDKSGLFDEYLQAYLKEGKTYPAARSAAMQKVVMANQAMDISDIDAELICQIINEPNNILGIEYIKAIRRLNSRVKPVTIQRISAHYHARELADEKANASAKGDIIGTDLPTTNISSPAISSATAIRNSILSICQSDDNIICHTATDISFNRIKSSVPDNVYQILRERYFKSFPITEEDFAQLLHYRLIYEDRQSLSEYMDVSEDLADRIKNMRDLNCGFEEFCKTVKSKNYTLTRINRALLHIVLNIRKSSVEAYCQEGYAQYARILGIKKESSQLLRLIDKKGALPVITKLSKADNMLDLPGRQMLTEDISATHLYNRIVYGKYSFDIPNEYKHGICIV